MFELRTRSKVNIVKDLARKSIRLNFYCIEALEHMSSKVRRNFFDFAIVFVILFPASADE